MTQNPYKILYVAYDGTIVSFEETYKNLFDALKSAIELEMAGHKIIKICPVK